MAVADDLTGAADLAGNLARPGAPVKVVRQAASLRGLSASRVLDAATRFLSPAAARRAVQGAWLSLPQAAGPILRFQKVDSTLRGNPGPEIEGFLLATQAPWVAVLPAYPSLGRQVQKGRVKVHGRDLMRSEYARDPLSPAKKADVAGLFAPRLCAHAPLAVVQRGPAALAAWIRRSARQARLVSFDCMDQLHLQVIAQACLRAGGRHFAGASALGAALASRLHGPPVRVAPPALPCFLVLGSVSASAFAQLEQGSALGRFLWAPYWRPRGRHWQRVGPAELRRLGRALRQGRAAALSSFASRDALRARLVWAQHRGLDPNALAEASLRRLADAALRAAPLQRTLWFLAGGHTLASFCERAGLLGLEVLGQLTLGVPLSRAWGPGGRPWIASRPGGFGGPDSLSRLVEPR
jgi:uncharacterized protein YgbK (DUF1537 family)